MDIFPKWRSDPTNLCYSLVMVGIYMDYIIYVNLCISRQHLWGSLLCHWLLIPIIFQLHPFPTPLPHLTNCYSWVALNWVIILFALEFLLWKMRYLSSIFCYVLFRPDILYKTELTKYSFSRSVWSFQALLHRQDLTVPKLSD